MEKKIFQKLLTRKDEIYNDWIMRVNEIQNNNYMSILSEDVYQETNEEFFTILITRNSNSEEGLAARLLEFTEKLIRLGWPLSYLTEGLQTFRQVSLEYLLEEEKDASKHRQIMNDIDESIEPIINQLVREYSGSWENIVSLQKVALEELSAPLIPIYDQITVMPLVGTIDTERAKLIMENLLDGVVKHGSEVVLIDITGVPVVDTMVAHHILQAAEAVRLIGSKCILVGIRPEIAQTIVNLGIDLSQFPTQSTLRKGFLAALNEINKQIVDLD